MLRGQAHLPDLKIFRIPEPIRKFSGWEGGLAPADFLATFDLARASDSVIGLILVQHHRRVTAGVPFIGWGVFEGWTLSKRRSKRLGELDSEDGPRRRTHFASLG